METLNKEIKKLAIFQTAFLGDVLLIIPIIHYILQKENFKIYFIVKSGLEDISKLLPDSVELITFNKKENKFKNSLQLIKTLREKEIDILISPHRSLTTSLIVYFSKPKLSIGFDKAVFSFLYKVRKEYIQSQHEIQRNLALLSDIIKIDDWRRGIKLQIEFNIKENKFTKWIERNENIIAIAPGSVWETKKYPQEYFIKLINLLTSRNYKIILIGSKDDEKSCSDLIEYSKNNSDVLNFIGKLKIYESLSVIDKCNLLVSNDSAPTHLGTLTNAKVLTIYGSTIPEFGFYPYREGDNYIEIRNLKCKPCGIHGKRECPEKHFRCMMDLKPEIIFERITEILEK